MPGNDAGWRRFRHHNRVMAAHVWKTNYPTPLHLADGERKHLRRCPHRRAWIGTAYSTSQRPRRRCCDLLGIVARRVRGAQRPRPNRGSAALCARLGESQGQETYIGRSPATGPRIAQAPSRPATSAFRWTPAAAKIAASSANSSCPSIAENPIYGAAPTGSTRPHRARRRGGVHASFCAPGIGRKTFSL